MRFFDLSLQLNGFPIKKAKRLLSEIQSKSDEEFDNYISHKRKDIVAFHLQHNSFYKSLVGSIDINEWSSVPVITKRDLQRPLEQRLSNNYSKNKVYVNKTSGSSGDPFIFAKDKFCHAMTWAMIQDRFSWYNLDFNLSKQARFYGIPLDKKGYYKERFKDWLGNRYRFSVFDLTNTAFDNVIKKCSNTKFEYINGYTSPIVQFAKYLSKKNIVLKDICPTFRACIVTSEMLFDDDKVLMQTVFGVPVINEYGASELDLIAFENNGGDWQINSETLFVEILDEEGNILPLGKEGRVVITSLYNEAHPFIRYDIGDIGVLSVQSTSRKPILEKLVGRTNDFAILPSGRKAAGLTFYYITKSVIENDGNVKEFTIEQTAKSKFIVNYVSDFELASNQKNIIKGEMERYLEPGLTITFNRLEGLVRSKSGKLRQFTSLVK